MRSYIARITATQGLLIGGNATHESAPFATREMAEQWAETVLRINAEAGRHAKLAKTLTVMRSRSQVVRA